MKLNAYAKINLSLEVIGRRPDGYHNISSLMQDIGLHDVIILDKCSEICAKYKAVHCSICKADVYLCTNINTIPLSEDNLAIKGARAVIEAMENKGITFNEQLYIHIDKQLPVAAGIAGGSGNAAAVMLGINALAGYPFSLRELMSQGVRVGADVPYSLMMNAKKNETLLAELQGIEEAGGAALVSGIGEIVEPAEPVHRYVIMANPGISVSTREAYEAIDNLQEALDESGLFTNQLEKYTLAAYPEAKALKDAMSEFLNADTVLMSGSGPTMVAYYSDAATAEKDFISLKSCDLFRSPVRAWLTETGCTQ